MTSTPDTDASDVNLTQRGRRSLMARAHSLQDGVIPRLHALDESDGRDDSTIAQHEAAASEIARIRHALTKARPAESLPDDSFAVELGEPVTIRLDDDGPQRYTIVDPNAALIRGGPRLPAVSPLGQALLGRHAGDAIDVPARGGRYRCTIESTTRTEPPEKAQ